MRDLYYCGSSRHLSKREKIQVQTFLLDNVGERRNHKYLIDYINICRGMKRRGCMGDLGIPYWRLIPYLDEMEGELRDHGENKPGKYSGDKVDKAPEPQGREAIQADDTREDSEDKKTAEEGRGGEGLTP